MPVAFIMFLNSGFEGHLEVPSAGSPPRLLGSTCYSLSRQQKLCVILFQTFLVCKTSIC